MAAQTHVQRCRSVFTLTGKTPAPPVIARREAVRWPARLHLNRRVARGGSAVLLPWGNLQHRKQGFNTEAAEKRLIPTGEIADVLATWHAPSVSWPAKAGHDTEGACHVAESQSPGRLVLSHRAPQRKFIPCRHVPRSHRALLYILSIANLRNPRGSRRFLLGRQLRKFLSGELPTTVPWLGSSVCIGGSNALLGIAGGASSKALEPPMHTDGPSHGTRQ